jgi:hypothetical protein
MKNRLTDQTVSLSRSSWRACVFIQEIRGDPLPAISKKELTRGHSSSLA